MLHAPLVTSLWWLPMENLASFGVLVPARVLDVQFVAEHRVYLLKSHAEAGGQDTSGEMEEAVVALRSPTGCP